jgi:hypothetical protein
MLDGDDETAKGFYYYLCPATLYAVQRAGHKLPVERNPDLFAHGLTPTFWQFCCANQHSKKMTHQQEAENFATDALTIGNAPPIEIIMRRTFHDHTEEKIEYLTDFLEDLKFSEVVKEGEEAEAVEARIAPSHASVTEPVHDLPMPDASAEDASSKPPSLLPAVTASKSKKREKKTITDDPMEH